MDKSFVSTKEIALALQKVTRERKLSNETISAMTEERNREDPSFPVVSVSTLSRLLREGGENGKYSYEDTLRPLASLLLNVDTFDSNDKSSAEALMSILHFKKDIIAENSRRIASLENELSSVKESSMNEINEEKAKYYEELVMETEKFQRSVDFLKNQIELKDQRISQLLEANLALQDKLLRCSSCMKGESHE